MEESFRMLYMVFNCIIFMAAISLFLNMDSILEKTYLFENVNQKNVEMVYQVRLK